MRLDSLYHWSPRERSQGIRDKGLVPGQKKHWYINPVTGVREAYTQNSISFSLEAETAWDYSHGCWKSIGIFDLWLVIPVDEDDIEIRQRVKDKIVEVRLKNIVTPDRLIWCNERDTIRKGLKID